MQSHDVDKRGPCDILNLSDAVRSGESCAKSVHSKRLEASLRCVRLCAVLSSRILVQDSTDLALPVHNPSAVCGKSVRALWPSASLTYAQEFNMMSQATTKNHVDQSQVDERLRKAILDKKKAQIEAWSRQIEQLQEGLQNVTSSLRSQTDERLSDLTEARDQAVKHLDQLQQSSQETWASILQQSDKVFQDVVERLHAMAQDQS
ncbi:hypothetical protein [Synechococcus sp. CBW1107]|uniref:hypothetical protein n=1 Tax=Synechococcus sp. CBW1107 TaxID=2789857 RepID=UPI002AD4396F|nr:hypothetical protein [Synechococcus sp. CBW1107]